MARRTDNLLDGIYVELVRSIYDAFVPSIIMSVGFVVAGALIAWETSDPIIAVLVAAGAIAGIVRLGVALGWRREALSPALDTPRAATLERRFAIPYYAFAIILGLFGARAFMLPAPHVHMLVICMLIGYDAGVAAGIALRPWIAIPCMVVALVPAIIAGFFGDEVYWATSLMSAGLLAGGTKSVLDRYRSTSREIGRRITFGNLARKDGLTALPNRLALREWFEESMTLASQPGLVAVHCLDLNGFKGVNDTHGHPIGDALLAVVARRLAHTIRETDMAARLGGDEFAIVQPRIQHADEAALLAQRIATVISRPFRIDNRLIAISTCIGYVLSSERSEDLEPLISRADEALYLAKRNGGGVVRYEAQQSSPKISAAA